jgi:hypothetical protein
MALAVGVVCREVLRYYRALEEASISSAKVDSTLARASRMTLLVEV